MLVTSLVCCPNLWYAYANPVCNINTFASCWTVSSNLHLLNFGTQYLPNTTHWTVNQEHADIYKMYLKSVNMTYYSPSLNTTITLATRAKHLQPTRWFMTGFCTSSGNKVYQPIMEERIKYSLAFLLNPEYWFLIAKASGKAANNCTIF